MSAIPNAFSRTLSGEALDIPPIWFMRQAGRYLPEYRAVREEAGSFLNLCYDPEKAARVTLQPIERYDLDAAILFADILLIPQALGMTVRFEAGEGPRLSPPLREQTFSPSGNDIHATLGPIYQTIECVRKELASDKALIGFAGAPWTVATYMIAGQGVKDPSALRQYAYSHPQAFEDIMGHLVDATASYLIKQVKAGVDAIQLFDSWAGGLPEPFFRKYCLEPTREIARRVKAIADIPFIAFPRGAGVLYEDVAKAPEIDAVSIDGSVPWDWAADHLSPHAVVQGGFDQLLIVEGGPAMEREALRLVQSFAGRPFVFNLGHGFVPQTPPDNVARLVEIIRS
ncbi:MAG: uroporphyrinogen decarboxylase [Parvularcula sp.]